MSKKSSHQLANKKTPLVNQLVLFIGLLLITISIGFKINGNLFGQKHNLEQIQENETKNTIPQTIEIDSLAQKLELDSQIYLNGIWGISEKNPSYLLQSAKPGENGNIIIYGHNKPGIFQNLSKVKPNDIVYLETLTNRHSYKVSAVQIVFPNQTQFLNKTDYEVLTIYTCSGFLDSKRLVIQAKPISV